jgi:hypothetical protein
MRFRSFFPILLVALTVSFIGDRLLSQLQTRKPVLKMGYDERAAKLERTYKDLLGPAYMPAYTAWYKQTIQLYRNGAMDGAPSLSEMVQARRTNHDTLLRYRFDEPDYKNSTVTIRMANGDVIEGQDGIKAKSTYHFHRFGSLVNVVPAFDPRTNCHTPVGGYAGPVPIYVGDADVAGIRTAMLQAKGSHGGDPTTTTSYYAPDLGCVILKNVTEFHDGAGMLTQVVTREATKVVIGEPESALFDLSSYQEMDPKTVHDKWVRFNHWDPATHPGGNGLLDREEDYRNFHLTCQH